MPKSHSFDCIISAKVSDDGEDVSVQVFISYSRKDLGFVKQLAGDLKRAGLNVWYDITGLRGGARWGVVLEEAIRSSEFVVLVLSPDSIHSEWVEKEFLFASTIKVPVVPLMYRACEPTLRYVNLKYIDVQGENYRLHFPELLKELTVDPEKVLLPVKAAAVPPGRRNTYLLSILALSAVLLGGMAVLQSNRMLFSSAEMPGSMPEVTETAYVPTFSPTAPPSATATITLTPRPTATPEPGFTIVAPEEALNLASGLQAFGQLAVEKYSVEERNKINNTLTFTINVTADTAILWRWYWCAVNDRILTQNMSKITVLFDANGSLIPREKLASYVFEHGDPNYAGWKCQAYETVLHDWKPGKYRFIQTMKIESSINDGAEKFEAGYKIYTYTVNVSSD